MTGAPATASRLPSLSTAILVAAALIALVSAGVAISRTAGGAGSAAGERPTAKDWRMVGWAYMENGRPDESAAAYRRAAELEPDNAENWSSLGEALQVASRSVVPEAAAAFEKAMKLDPSDPRARYFLAVQKDLRGDHEGAVADWLAFLRDTPPGAPWEADLRRNIEQTAARHDIDIAGRVPPPGGTGAAGAAIPGPTPEQMAAASSIPPGRQDEMVKGMVERLAGRLRQNPRDADGWIRLMRSRMVLGESEAAGEALRSGLDAFRDDSATQGRLRSAAAELGVPSDG